MNNNVRMNMYYIYSFLLTAVILRDRSMAGYKEDGSIGPAKTPWHAEEAER